MKEKILRNYSVLLLLLFIDSLGNGVSSVLLPEVIYNSGLTLKIFGVIAAAQSLIGVFILLPQANFIAGFGEIQSVRLGVFTNMIVYLFYSFGSVFSVVFGKFTEGFADRLLNSSLSKLVYDYTDDKNNRGRYRALMDTIANIGSLLVQFSPRLDSSCPGNQGCIMCLK